MGLRISVDTGGTFTDVVVATGDREVIAKAPTTPDRIFVGMRNALENAAEQLGQDLEALLGDTDVLIYGTTRATNAIVQGAVAKTAFLVTAGFPDILVLKEGGKPRVHDFATDYPDPYIPQAHTFEIAERVDSEGGVVESLDREQVRSVLARLKEREFEAVAVCLLWAVANPVHEQALGKLLEEELPGVPYTLSHRLIPIVREYRRASATAIDASLKPLMQTHLRDMENDLRAAGCRGEILVSTTVGGSMHVEELVERPIHTVKSGPAMAPVAALAYSRVEEFGDDVIVCDTGGTTFDVSLIRDGELKHTRETWIGGQWIGHILAISSVDVRSIGAGGGSIAWIDPGGLLRVGPRSAGAVPGPACYGAGGTEPTVTDAALVLGYLDPDYFLGGRMDLDVDAARRAVGGLSEELGTSLDDGAHAIMNLANELMIKAIHDITVTEGFNPQECAVVAGGGAAGLGIMAMAGELGCERVILPRTAGVLSACGMQFSDVIYEHSASHITRSDAFDFDAINGLLEMIDAELKRFAATLEGRGLQTVRIDHFVEARYLFQVWELDVSLPVDRFRGPEDVAALVERFHATHEQVFAVRDPDSLLECLNWKGRLSVSLGGSPSQSSAAGSAHPGVPHQRREAYFGGGARVETPIYLGKDLHPGATIEGPAIIEEPTTTIVVNPGMRARLSGADNFILEAS
jgi:N-methylhydantoinase A